MFCENFRRVLQHQTLRFEKKKRIEIKVLGSKQERKPNIMPTLRPSSVAEGIYGYGDKGICFLEEPCVVRSSSDTVAFSRLCSHNAQLLEVV